VWVLSDIDVRTELLQKLRSYGSSGCARWLAFWYGIKVDENIVNSGEISSAVSEPNMSYTLPVEVGTAEKRRTARIQQQMDTNKTSTPDSLIYSPSTDVVSNIPSTLVDNSYDSHTRGDFHVAVSIETHNPMSGEVIDGCRTINNTSVNSHIAEVSTLKPQSRTFDDDDEPVPYGHADRDYIIEQLHASKMRRGIDSNKQDTGFRSSTETDSFSSDLGGYGVVPSGDDAIRVTNSGSSRQSFQYS
jgi:hypothetical protein